MKELPGPVTSVDVISDFLQSEILDGAYPPGARIAESALALRFGVARHTVRAALSRLAARSVLRVEVNRGWSVPVFTTVDLRELLEVRTAIELHALRIVVRRGDPLSDRVQAVRQAIRAVPDDVDAARWRDLDVDLHRALVAQAGNSRLLELFDGAVLELRLARLQLSPLETGIGEWRDSHELLVASIESGELDVVERMLEQHVALDVSLARGSRT